jgi:putative ABC transport system permease protein
MAIPALHKKLLRDLVRLAGPAFAVALVVASGIMAYVAMRGAYLSIDFARDRFYARSHFADIFAHVVRAPLSVAHEVERMPDVDVVEARVTKESILDVPGFAEPVRGQLLSLPERLNDLTLRRGRLPEPQHADEAVVSEAFALAHGLEPGASLGVIVGGSRRVLESVGVAASPEFALVIVLGGALLGIAGGIALGGPMIELYRTYFRFDELAFTLR